MNHLGRRGAELAALVGLLAPTTSPVRGDEGGAQVVTTVLRRIEVDPQRVDGSSLTLAPRAEHAAFRVEVSGGQAWSVDGAEGPAFDTLGPLVFSDDGRRWAYLGRRGTSWSLVVDGAEQPTPYPSLSERSLRWSPGGKHLAYQASRLVPGEPMGEALVVDGVAGPAFRGGEYATLVLAADGTAAYVALDGDEHVVVVGGKAGARHPRGSIQSLVLSADGKRHAYVLATKEGQAVVADGKPGPVTPRVGPPTFAPTGSRLLHVAMRPSKVHVVVDGVEGAAYDDLAAPGPTFSPDGQHVAYAARKGAGFVVVRDGVEGTTYTKLGGESLRWSPDGKRLLHWAVQGPKAFFVVDGVEQPPVQLVGTADNAAFSPDGKRVAYAAKVEGAWTVVTDGVPGPKLDGVGTGFPRFSPDGRHVVAQVKAGGRWHLLVDGELGPAVDAFAEGPVGFGHDGRTAACLARRGSDWHLLIAGRGTSEPFPMPLPGQGAVADGPASFHAWVAGETGELVDLRAAAAP